MLLLNEQYSKNFLISKINILRGKIIIMKHNIIDVMKDIVAFFGYIAEIRNRRIFIPYDIFHCISRSSKNNIKNLYKTKF